MAQIPFPKQRKLYLPGGGALVATRRQGEDVYDQDATYAIECVGKNHALRDFIGTMPQGKQRAVLLKILDLEARDPVVVLHRLVGKKVCQPDMGYKLFNEEVIAIILQSRALSSNGRVMAEGDRCSGCSSVLCGPGFAMPFIECAGVSDYDAVAITCANCVWMGKSFIEVDGKLVQCSCNLRSHLLSEK